MTRAIQVEDKKAGKDLPDQSSAVECRGKRQH
jgi:hypothetical protein